MSTIYKVAQLAGVSTATVSRVINNRAGVNEETLRKVNNAMEQVRFRPRWKAAPPKSVGVVVFSHKNCLAFPYNATLLSAASEVFFAEGYAVQLIPCTQSSAAMGQIVRLAGTHQVQGVLIFPFHPIYDLSEQVECEGIPYIAVCPARSDTQLKNYLTVDDVDGGFQAARYLWDLGHRRLGVVTASLQDHGHRGRLDGVIKFLESKGLSADAIVHRQFADADRRCGESAAAEIMVSENKPTALIVTNSTLAKGVVRGCRRLGLTIPRDVSILGFEDNDELSDMDPPITVIQQPTRRLGEMAASLLLKQFAGDEIQTLSRIGLSLLVRESTAALASSR